MSGKKEGGLDKRKETGEELRESEKKFRTIFESANDVIMYVDRYGKIIDINERVEDILGYRRKDVVGKNFAKTGALTVKELPRIIKLFAKSIRKGSVLGGGHTNIMELNLRHKNGKVIPLESSTRVIKKNGKVEGFLNILRDITERKKAEKILKESEEKYRILAETSTDGILTTDKVGILTYTNPALENMFDIPSSVALGTYFSKYVTKKSALKATRLFLNLARRKSESVRNVELTAVRRDKHVFPIEVSASSIIRDGKFEGIECIVRDITERKKVEETIEDERKKLETYIESMVDGVVITDAKSIIIQANKSYADILGYKSSKEMTGKPSFEIIAKKDRPGMMKMFTEDMKKKTRVFKEVELTYLKRDGKEVPVMVSVRNVWDEKRNFVYSISVVRDITKRKRADEELRKSKKELEKKIYDLERFSKFGVGRELRMVELKKRIIELENLLRKHGIKPERVS